MSEEKRILIDDIRELLEDSDLTKLRALLDEQRSSDIAEIVEFLGDEDKDTIMHLLDIPTAAEVFEKVDEATRATLFELLKEDELKNLISELDPDEIADILAELPEKESFKLLKQLKPEQYATIKNWMQYSEDSAGGIMDPVLISVPENTTVTQAIEEIRRKEIDEDFFVVYVVDNKGTFLGHVKITSLLTSQPSRLMKTLIDPDTVTVNINDDQEEIRNIFSKNDLIVAPVLDNNGILVGRITADRIIEVAEEEAAEDIFAMAGTDADELDKTSILHAARIRMTWLIPCLLGTGVTAMVLILFKNFFLQKQLLHMYVVAVAFVPMITAISGNAGLQTSAIVVCGLATGHLAARRLNQVFMREARVAFFVATSCGIIGGLICSVLQKFLEYNNGNYQTVIHIPFSEFLKIVMAFSAAMFSSILVATTLGLFLPFFFKKIGIDPAISSGPLVTTANDSISAAIYLSMTFSLLVFI